MIRVRFQPDWGHIWPLWNESDIDDLATTPQHLGLSESLAVDLRTWYDFWALHVDPDPVDDPGQSRWDSEENYSIWRLAAPAVAARVAHELDGRAELVLPEWIQRGIDTLR